MPTPHTSQSNHSTRHEPPNRLIVRVILLPQIRGCFPEELISSAHSGESRNRRAISGKGAESANVLAREGGLDGGYEEAGAASDGGGVDGGSYGIFAMELVVFGGHA